MFPWAPGPRSLTILANDQDLDGNNLTIKARTNGAHGTVARSPAADRADPPTRSSSYHGIDTFTYTISDGLVSDTATVLVTVDRDKTAPVVVAPIERFPATVGSSTTKARLTWSAKDPAIRRPARKPRSASMAVAGRRSRCRRRPRIDRADAQDRPHVPVPRPRRRRHGQRQRLREGSAVPGRPLLRGECDGRVASASGRRARRPGYPRRSTRHATSSAKRARFAFTGYDVGWIATTATSSGKARIYIDGALVGTIDLGPHGDGVSQAGLRPPSSPHAGRPRPRDPTGRRRASRHRRVRRAAVGCRSGRASEQARWGNSSQIRTSQHPAALLMLVPCRLAGDASERVRRGPGRERRPQRRLQRPEFRRELSDPRGLSDRRRLRDGSSSSGPALSLANDTDADGDATDFRLLHGARARTGPSRSRTRWFAYPSSLTTARSRATSPAATGTPTASPITHVTRRHCSAPGHHAFLDRAGQRSTHVHRWAIAGRGHQRGQRSVSGSWATNISARASQRIRTDGPVRGLGHHARLA